MKSLKYIFIGIALIATFLLGRSCTPEPQIIEKVTHTSDTIYPDTVVVYEPQPYPVHDTVIEVYPYPIPPDSFTMAEFFKMRFYKRSYRDSNVVIDVEDSIVGYLMARKIGYRLFVPLKVVDTITIEKYAQNGYKYEIKGGLDLMRTNTFIGIDVDVKKHTFGVSYDPFNKAGLIRYRYTLFRK